jgi:hypothetical protein
VFLAVAQCLARLGREGEAMRLFARGYEYATVGDVVIWTPRVGSFALDYQRLRLEGQFCRAYVPPKPCSECGEVKPIRVVGLHLCQTCDLKRRGATEDEEAA